MYLSLDVRHDVHWGTTVLVGGELDPCSGEQLIAYATDVMRRHGPCLAVDLAEVTFLDCGGVRGLLAVRNRARLMGGHLSVVATSAPVRRILGILELDSLFACAASVG